ncbi:F-box/WD repeat-containing protein 4-like isoform X2 [Eurytemora carolleeae]|uniref:F-box/WD repeat-containing protein 4-like isoform X2 n=1 Tax=Eurytemora carolleeae TaxID=1294199 RepID=UPI000C75EE1B|nr:F-box/WD repeat-containing protein 4-like isoform X2 [Eurytemora carolleeae]XP_023322975.1 F-box/WD repeat-containing protein 4-like isoform X2 [Eurytemora carolleeae]|eukprot:XP_023322974.1 F-box/WD repeat-containing protein 4-like isoform X2 [Eurytemora affinis]
MSALDIAQISACLKQINLTERRRRERLWSVDMRTINQVGLLDLPDCVLVYILELLDETSRTSACSASTQLFNLWIEYTQEENEFPVIYDENENCLTLENLPADVLLVIFKYLDISTLGRVAQVCKLFRSLSYSDFLWMRAGASSLGSNQLDTLTTSKSQAKLGAREKVRIGENWKNGKCKENILAVQNNKYMPRLQLEKDVLWVSWGKTIWCHPRGKDGAINPKTKQMFRGHTDDVSRFVVGQGMLVSGGRDRSICAWNSATGDFMFARRYCHNSEITAVDVTGKGRILVSGSRDKSIIVWRIEQEQEFKPILVKQLGINERVWSLSINQETGFTMVGTAGTRGVPPLRLLDLHQGQVLLDLGRELRNGAGMLDLTWLTGNTLLSCGYDTCARLWDTRCGTYVSTWEEPYDESVYSLCTDGVNCLVTGTSRHGRVRVWDLRCTKPQYMKYASPAVRGRSSPVYSLVMDSDLNKKLNYDDKYDIKF